ncbi:MAG: hypothetical protein IAF58_08950, partial [Leptolyngbya sp.]|nr:hypothetical protein [Candidatus Melainabacteria bacterium]
MSSNTLSFQPPTDASVQDKQNTSASGIDYYQFSQGDWKAANAQRNASNGDKDCCKCEITDKPEDQATERTIDDLRNGKSTAARLTALGKLADDGIQQFLMLDKDGTARQYRIETEKCGNRTLIHCYGNDDKGEERVVMRAARTADGEFEQERNKDGKHVSYYGDIWTREMQGKSSLVGDASQFASHKPVPSGDS